MSQQSTSVIGAPGVYVEHAAPVIPPTIQDRLSALSRFGTTHPIVLATFEHVAKFVSKVEYDFNAIVAFVDAIDKALDNLRDGLKEDAVSVV